MADDIPPAANFRDRGGRGDARGTDPGRKERGSELAAPEVRPFSDLRSDARGKQGNNGPSRRAAFQRQSYAAIDLGTNNCRLLIARASGENLIVIDAFSRVVRLGEGLGQTGRLSDAAMDRAMAALKVCADKLKRRNVYLARSVATEACRRADNGEEFIERVRKETGIALDIISAREEARLARGDLAAGEALGERLLRSASPARRAARWRKCFSPAARGSIMPVT